MNRRSFFGMFGALSAVTAAGIILPETVKSYFFMPQVVNVKNYRAVLDFSAKDLTLSIDDYAKRFSSSRIIRAYDVSADRFPIRLDVVGEWQISSPDLPTVLT